MLSPYVFYALWHGNVDSLVLMGATLSPAWGIWLLLLKPQLSIGLSLVWFYRSYQKGWKTPLYNFGPASAVYLGCWILGIHPTTTPIHEPWNIQAWPWGIFPGLVLVWLAIKNKNNKLAIAASPFTSPYVGLQTWVGTLLPATGKLYLLIFGTVLGWIFVLTRWKLNFDALKYEPVLLVGWGIILILINFRETVDLRKQS